VSATTPGRVLFVSGSGGANTLRYRVRLAEEALRSRGVVTAAVHFTDPQLRQWADDADLVWLYRTPASRRVLRLVEHARERLGVPVTFDVDDLVFHGSHLPSIPFLAGLAPGARELFEGDVVRRGTVLPFVDRASGSTRPIVDELAALVDAPVDLLPNGVSRVGAQLAARTRRRAPDGRVRVGYFSGSATHDDDWREIEPAVVALLRADPRVDLWIVGPLATGPALTEFDERVVRLGPVRWTELPALLAEVDVNLAPLDVTPFTEGKSAIKWLEAALVGTPTLATATPPFRDAIDDGRTGLLVPPGGDWTGPLARIVDDADLRSGLGDAAREAGLAEFGPEVQADRYLAFVIAAVEAPRAHADAATLSGLIGAASPVRTLGIGLEGYPFPEPLGELQMPAPRGAEAFSRGRSSVRSALKTGQRGSRALIRRGRRYSRGVARRVRRVTRPAPPSG
jgi:glycosyltransferase involved in cell wall biosynthesis